jgi:head-tail adaptor
MSKKPYIGQKDRRIAVSKKTFVQNEVGEPKETIVLITEAFAFMEDVSGGEDVEGKIRHLYNRTYTIRYNNDIVTGSSLLVIDGEQTFEVNHILEIGRRDHIKLVCKTYE